MKHMTLSEFIETESDEPVFIVDGPQPIVGTCSPAYAALLAKDAYRERLREQMSGITDLMRGKSIS